MSASMTSGQRKQIVRLFGDGANWALNIVEQELTREEVQRLLRRGHEVRANFPELIRELARGRYANEEVKSNYIYPPEYRGLKPIREQVEILLGHFPNLDASWAIEKGEAWYENIKPSLPTWIEGPLVYVWREASYHGALQLVLDRLAASRKFCNYRNGQIDTKHLKQTELTEQVECKLHQLQPGGFLIVPSQMGIWHGGRSVRRAREVFALNEFGHGSLAVGCHALTHPERFVLWEQLHADCAGDEFSDEGDGQFEDAPCFFHFHEGSLEFDAGWVSNADGRYGSGSGFVPQASIAA